ncbi:MAG: UDP-N-acetylmuramoyl-L-alanine--D-glutamate ligase [Thermodesulfobacteriota bacterium]|nr:UDP-N-acetylmuramoyl-L-alanine--D-glutamate ligase [Thermodesulfobacteriota bacterium]
MRVVVWGTGRTGMETARVLSGEGHEVRLVDEFMSTNDLPANDLPANDLPIKDPLTGHIASGLSVREITQADMKWADLVVPSPGIPRDHPLFAHAKEVLSEIECAYRRLSGRIIAVTGTNGKTTTVTLIHAILKEAGMDVGLGGNISPPLIALTREDPEIVVVEISSFQLEWIDTFRPSIAVCLNLSPDHLDRYHTMDEYIHYKLRIFENQGSEDLCIINDDDARLKALYPKAETIRFSSDTYTDGRISLFSGREGPLLKDAQGLGSGVIEDMIAAALVCDRLGIDKRVMEKVFNKFGGIKHRYENVGTVDGVSFIDDSKATNVGAVEKALTGTTGRAVLILGGTDKGGDFASMAKMHAQKIRKAIILGTQADRIREEIRDIVETLDAGDMMDAVEKAYKGAQPGDAVILSPGCASFDMFSGYAQRGEVFTQCAKKLMRSKR